MPYFAVFGSHPELALAELHAVLDDRARMTRIENVALVEDAAWSGEKLMQRLGGTVKLGEIVETIPTSTLTGESLATPPLTPPLKVRGGVGDEVLNTEGAGRSLNFGLTIFGSNAFSKLPIEFKRALKSRGIASRWVTGKGGSDIAPAAVAKLGMTQSGTDFVILVEKNHARIGVTTHVQDADAWSLRDYGRPARNELAGMLPPKLARMMVNLATPLLSLNKEGGRGVILDPFCGSGTILMEAALAFPHARIIGSDLSAQQISDTKKNIEWLINKNVLTSSDAPRIKTFVADARRLSQELKPRSIDAVVTEGHLGPPLKGHESRATLERNAKEITELWRRTLKEVRPLLAPGAKLVCVWPVFKTSGGIVRVDLEKNLPALGYRLVDPFESFDISAGPLLYHRPGQQVMRQIVLLRLV